MASTVFNIVVSPWSFAHSIYQKPYSPSSLSNRHRLPVEFAGREAGELAEGPGIAFAEHAIDDLGVGPEAGRRRMAQSLRPVMGIRAPRVQQECSRPRTAAHPDDGQAVHPRPLRLAEAFGI